MNTELVVVGLSIWTSIMLTLLIVTIMFLGRKRPMANKIHARNPDQSGTVLCGESRESEQTWDRDKVTCLRCTRILIRRK